MVEGREEGKEGRMEGKRKGGREGRIKGRRKGKRDGMMEGRRKERKISGRRKKMERAQERRGNKVINTKRKEY